MADDARELDGVDRAPSNPEGPAAPLIAAMRRWIPRILLLVSLISGLIGWLTLRSPPAAVAQVLVQAQGYGIRYADGIVDTWPDASTLLQHLAHLRDQHRIRDRGYVLAVQGAATTADTPGIAEHARRLRLCLDAMHLEPQAEIAQ